MGPELLILNRISRHIAQAVLPIPRIGRKGHKSSCFVGISTILPSPWDQSLFLMCQCMQTFPLWLYLLEHGDTEETGLGLCSWEKCSRQEHVLGDAPIKQDLQEFAVRRAAEAQDLAGTSIPRRNIRDPGQPFLWSVCGSVITCS